MTDWLSPLTLAEIIAICKEYQIYVSDAARRKSLPNKRKSDSPVQGPRKKMKNSGPSASINGDDTMDKSDEITLPSIVNNNHITTSPEFLHIPPRMSFEIAKQSSYKLSHLRQFKRLFALVVNVRNIPNAGRLQPADQDRHLAQVLIAGMLLEEKGVIEVKGKCSGARDDPTCLQSGLHGNVTSYPMNTDEIFSMLQGHMLPQPMEILPSIISVTVVLEALEWLIEHNKCFSEYTVDQAVMASLPEDDVPLEILASMRQETSSHILLREHDSYVPGDFSDDYGNVSEGAEPPNKQYDEGDVVPLQYIGSSQTELTAVSTSDLLEEGLTNLSKESQTEQPYAV
ncbi:uncharacterized protein EI90DRAFT_3019274 [Cantharellus anzutake]|uniref:uncharacterized protein n=1 Tax=Cantharellus anzutake TaxID=1750568 RepID=UPI001907BA39|nr:uncharacterized protein EI90DRAFT_3019274 [Cantharellus anzutake]KAF8325100.1 hypothetical protein EI90DRAFT_3019274 [Cantharellus anzutake]